jgi:hypothetical protein
LVATKKASPKGGWRLEILILRLGIEARTVFVDIGEVAVTEDSSVRIILLQAAQQGDKSGLLRGGAGVGRSARGV